MPGNHVQNIGELMASQLPGYYHAATQSCQPPSGGWWSPAIPADLQFIWRKWLLQKIGSMKSYPIEILPQTLPLLGFTPKSLVISQPKAGNSTAKTAGACVLPHRGGQAGTHPFTGFQSTFTGFPNITGFIDCTHIVLIVPERKVFHSSWMHMDWGLDCLPGATIGHAGRGKPVFDWGRGVPTKLLELEFIGILWFPDWQAWWLWRKVGFSGFHEDLCARLCVLQILLLGGVSRLEWPREMTNICHTPELLSPLSAQEVMLVVLQ